MPVGGESALDAGHRKRYVSFVEAEMILHAIFVVVVLADYLANEQTCASEAKTGPPTEYVPSSCLCPSASSLLDSEVCDTYHRCWGDMAPRVQASVGFRCRVHDLLAIQERRWRLQEATANDDSALGSAKLVEQLQDAFVIDAALAKHHRFRTGAQTGRLQNAKDAASSCILCYCSCDCCR